MAEVVATSSQPALGAIRLAWWREACERLDRAPPPPEPRLEGAARHLLPAGVSGAALAGLEAGWAALLDETPDADAVAQGGACLFALLARLCAPAPSADTLLDAAGGLFGLVRAMRLGHGALRPQAQRHLAALEGVRAARPLRPVTALARLAARDLKRWPQAEPPATPGRAAALLSHRLFGTIA